MPGRAPRKSRSAKSPRRAPARAFAKLTRAAGGLLPPMAGPAIKLSNQKAKNDPRFKRVMDKLQRSAATTKQHPPASQKANQAQAAALPPANEKLAGAKASQVGTMNNAETGKPDESSFLAMLRAAIDKAIPKKTAGAKDFMKGDDKQQLKDSMTGKIGEQKDEATGGIKSASDQAPDPNQVPGKEVVAMPADPASSAPPVGAADAMPPPKTASEVSLEQGTKDADKAVKDADLSEGQLKEANDPRFSRVVTAKQEVDTKAQALPQKYRTDEKGVIAGAAAKAVNDEKKGLAGALGAKKKSGVAVKARQMTAKEKDELRRKEVAKNIEGIYNRTKEAVDKKLASLETDVGDVFDQGTEAALTKMRDYVDTRFDDRYSGIRGKARWLKDKFITLPASVKAWFDESRKVFTQELDKLVVRVANMVETRLKEAKDLIATGEKEISTYVASLPEDLKAVGTAAQKEVADSFDEMRRGVDDKKQDLAQNLAQRYKESSEKADKALKEMRDAHKSLVEKLKEFVGEVVEVLRNFKNRLMGMLKKGKDAIGLIVAHPIRFLGNLLSAIKLGIQQFVDRIWEHLQAGFLKWLFGSLADTGITMPKDLSLPSILMLVLQVLGLTYDRLRAKAVKLIGERNVAIIEKVFEFLKVLWTGGPTALWEKLKEYLSDIKEQVIDAIQDWVITTIIKKATIKIATMFNPVGAIIQAILMIYDTAMFFIENINRILDFVEAVINSFYKIATGAIGDAANWIEKALANTIPIIIGFLARLLGISGITDKIVSTIKKIQSKVDKAVDKVIDKIVGGIKKLVGAGKAVVGAVLQWWKAKKQFKAGEESHTLYFKGEGNTAQAMISSVPQNLDDYYNKTLLPKHGAGKTEMIAIRKSIDAITLLRQKSDMTVDDGKKIAGHFEVIAPNIVTLEGGEIPQSAATWPSQQTVAGSTLGKTLGATILSMRAGKDFTGSSPHDTTPVWKAVSARPDTYVRGHLLNHNLHGPGSNKNMTPITIALNNEMARAVENPTKDAVFSRRATMRYSVTFAYKNPHPDRNSDPAKNWIDEERYLPTHVTMEAREVEKKANSWVDKPGGLEKKLAKDHALPRDLRPVGIPAVNLNEANEDKLTAIPGIGPVRAKAIIALRKKRKRDGITRFNSYDDLKDANIPSDVLDLLKSKGRITLY